MRKVAVRSGRWSGRLRASGLGVLLLGSAFAGPAPALGQQESAGPGPAMPEASLHALVNRHREAVGCTALLWHAPSAAVATARSRDMRSRGYFDHVTPDDRTVFDEMRDAEIEAWGSIAENIALTPAGASSVLELWRDSPPHRRNLENCAFTHHGLGEHTGVWTQVLLAQPKNSAPAPPADLDAPPAGLIPPPASPPRSVPR